MNDTIASNQTSTLEFGDLSLEDAQRIFDAATRRTFKSGEKLIQQGEIGKSMFIILYGRVRMSIRREDGNEQVVNILQQGDHFGELSLLIGGCRAATATAIMDTTVLEISKRDFYALTKALPAFSIKLSRTIGKWLLGAQTRSISRHKHGIIGLVRTTELTSFIAQSIARYFASKNKRIEIFTDRVSFWELTAHNNIFPIHALNQASGDFKFLHDLAAATKRCDHVFVDLFGARVTAELLLQCERIWWFMEQNIPATATITDQAEQILKQHSELKNRLQIVWIQPKSYNLADNSPSTISTHLDPIRCIYNAYNKEVRPADLTRLYHIARDVQLGLALGGGGAHGLAHIGVIAAFEEQGLYFDRVAGTSAGAIIAVGLGAGFNPKHLLNLFNNEMKPPRILTYFPKATQFHLWTLFRFGLIEHRFRKYLKDLKLEQLLLPVHTISTDLITGQAVIRSSGEAVSCVLESINYPVFGKPIWRDGLALVDGGVLINVPSSVLRKQQTGYIVAVDVGAKLHPTFGKNTPQTRASEMKHVGYFSTLNRVLEVSSYELAKMHMSESDFLITPDTSAYPFADFTRGEQLFEIGYNAAQKAMPELKQSYERFVEME
ncbi:patatin-like phospholipase family protein [Nitrosomonas aestuarii]|uniref:patatin-like phospholipase family protein n=1 Tax=Nitrosomonas aestuarii TaxID=52441 RepID=UPI000D319A6B|nr:cyclic nucleotide-binding and patatin-like phospholipase domain-containing protein [Nitrosomonas aestuarii]PTN12956.1 putative acylesterase/phospholipase RssA [Nitrosomonas aestuarii]